MACIIICVAAFEFAITENQNDVEQYSHLQFTPTFFEKKVGVVEMTRQSNSLTKQQKKKKTQ